ncbi:MAG TPA: TadE/TadG family type IV pilus assembly protein [Gemmataceae bacterium]|nr:TadE/TadG family type IV pilus assembly protein [Gemmataceae bacterium]
MILPSNRRQRRAAAVVETAAVLIVFILLLFGVLEYCRYFFMRQLVDNAAREGARYAVVHTNDATVDADTRTQILNRMNGMDQKMISFTIQTYHADASGNRVTVYDSTATSGFAYATDGTGNYLLDGTGTKIYTSSDATGPYVLNSVSQKVYLNMNSTTKTVTGVNAGLFNSYVSAKQIQSVDGISNAAFGQCCVVEITSTYSPITPSFLRLGQTLTIHSKVMMYSEAN